MWNDPYRNADGSDTELAQLEKIGQSGGRNPIQETRYQQLKSSIPAAIDPLAEAKKQQEALLAKQKAETEARFLQGKNDITDFTNRYKVAVPQIVNDTSAKYGLDTLLGQANSLNTRVKTLQGNLNNAGAGGYANAGQVDAAVNSRYLPAAQTAVTNLQTGTALAQNEENQLFKPYDVEGAMLTERLAREATGYTAEQNRELDALIAQLNAGVSLTTAQIQRATALATAEKNYQQAIEVAKLNNPTTTTTNAKDRYISIGDGLYDVQTGNIIQKPKTGTGSNGWG